jgi:anthranilate synthase component 2
MLVLIDNYDSFTYNLWHYLGELGAEAGICLELVARCAKDTMPLMGVCLGHQAIGQAFGGSIERSPKPMHGKVSEVKHDGNGVFEQLPSPLRATRYHSLTIVPESVPGCLEINAQSDDGVIMGVRHRELPIHGVQFHPESIESEHGHAMLRNFLRETKSGAPA